MHATVNLDMGCTVYAQRVQYMNVCLIVYITWFYELDHYDMCLTVSHTRNKSSIRKKILV